MSFSPSTITLVREANYNTLILMALGTSYTITRGLNAQWYAKRGSGKFVALTYELDSIKLRVPDHNWTIEIDYSNPHFALVVANRISESI